MLIAEFMCPPFKPNPGSFCSQWVIHKVYWSYFLAPPYLGIINGHSTEKTSFCIEIWQMAAMPDELQVPLEVYLLFRKYWCGLIVISSA